MGRRLRNALLFGVDEGPENPPNKVTPERIILTSRQGQWILGIDLFSHAVGFGTTVTQIGNALQIDIQTYTRGVNIVKAARDGIAFSGIKRTNDFGKGGLGINVSTVEKFFHSRQNSCVFQKAHFQVLAFRRDHVQVVGTIRILTNPAKLESIMEIGIGKTETLTGRGLPHIAIQCPCRQSRQDIDATVLEHRKSLRRRQIGHDHTRIATIKERRGNRVAQVNVKPGPSSCRGFKGGKSTALIHSTI
mmetsp:Transcript_35111/g.73128  ORF Transcript_35111/g.73128 Transcript_35111/m.73128 type:complete len:247 (-) Transcript_35111:463-1203(-)